MERPEERPLDTTRALLAADIGGTSSRIEVRTPKGQLLGAATGPGCNLRSSGPDAFTSLAATMREALGAVPGKDVAHAVLAFSGAGPAQHQQVQRATHEAAAPLGIDGSRITVTDDHLVAFLAGGVGDDGILLLAGTGAVTVSYRDRRPIQRRDGMGWLLGDVGSAVWLGRRTVQAVAADLDHRGPRTRLTELVGDMLDLDLRDGLLPPSPIGDTRQDLIRALDSLVPAGSPAGLGRFAPLPGTVLEDPVARDILDTAIRHFCATVRELDPSLELPVVLAGSVLATPGPIREEVMCGFEAEGREHRTVASGLPGAIILAREMAEDDTALGDMAGDDIAEGGTATGVGA